METLTLEEIRTLQLAVINLEDGLLAQGIVKMKYLHEKLERMATSLPTLREIDGLESGAKSESSSPRRN